MTEMTDLTDLTWYQMPVDAGQIVDVTYAFEPIGGGDGWLYRRTHDRSDGTRSVERAAVEDDASGVFQPWNGLLPEHGEWQDVA